MQQQQLLRPQIVLLREGTDTSQGTGQILSNINACSLIVDTLKTTLGPRGLDKLIVSSQGKATISNDGATIMRLLEVAHPAARALVDIARAQDAEVGDGTTSVVVLAGELLQQAKSFVEDGVSAQLIIQAYRKAAQMAIKRVDELTVDISTLPLRQVLEECAATSLNSKLIYAERDYFKTIVVDAVQKTVDSAEGSNWEKLIGIKGITGGSLTESFLVDGVAFERTFTYAGFEQQPKKIQHPRILCLNVELEQKAERENAEVRIESVQEYQSIVDAEWNILKAKLDAIYATGAQVVLSRLPIGDLATQYFADRGVFCAGRVPQDDLERVMHAVGGTVLTSLLDIIPAQAVGTCDLFEERQVGAKRINFFLGCAQAKSCTLILRGGSEQFLAETERSLHDALMIVRRCLKHPRIVAGGGAVEMQVAKYIREQAMSVAGKSQMLLVAFARAFECIPRQLAENGGLDANDLLTQLRKQHSTPAGKWSGIDLGEECVSDMWAKYVWEPSVVKSNLIMAACEAACMVLSVDLTIRAPAAADPSQSDLAKMAARAGLN